MTIEEIERIEARLKIFREAAETGREVQYISVANQWVDSSKYEYNDVENLILSKCDLRLKPEPRRFWVVEWPNKTTSGAFDNKEHAEVVAKSHSEGVKLIELVEVLK